MWMTKSSNCMLTKTHPQSVVVHSPDSTGKVIGGRQKVSTLKIGRLKNFLQVVVSHQLFYWSISLKKDPLKKTTIPI